jgi:hypothetical protein
MRHGSRRRVIERAAALRADEAPTLVDSGPRLRRSVVAPLAGASTSTATPHGGGHKAALNPGGPHCQVPGSSVFLPERRRPVGVVVAVGPLTSVKEQAAGAYAQAMADRPAAVRTRHLLWRRTDGPFGC